MAASASSLIKDVFGYGILYIYPLKKDLMIIGYIVLGKRYSMDIEMKLLRELEIVCDIFNKSFLLSDNGPPPRDACEGYPRNSP